MGTYQIQVVQYDKTIVNVEWDLYESQVKTIQEQVKKFFDEDLSHMRLQAVNNLISIPANIAKQCIIVINNVS